MYGGCIVLVKHTIPYVTRHLEVRAELRAAARTARGADAYFAMTAKAASAQTGDPAASRDDDDGGDGRAPAAVAAAQACDLA